MIYNYYGYPTLINNLPLYRPPAIMFDQVDDTQSSNWLAEFAFCRYKDDVSFIRNTLQ